MIYEAVNTAIFPLIPSRARRILDLGCGTGGLGAAIKARFDTEVVGVTYSEEEATLARARLDDVLVRDLNTVDTSELGRFDCIVCSHVLEHLENPERLVKALRANLVEPDGVLVVALPNALFLKQRIDFLRGRFRYTDGGLMDRTHLRFFDRDTALGLVRSAGYEVVAESSEGYFPLPGLRPVLGQGAAKIDRWAAGAMPGLFAVQFIIAARPLRE